MDREEKVWQIFQRDVFRARQKLQRGEGRGTDNSIKYKLNKRKGNGEEGKVGGSFCTGSLHRARAKSFSKRKVAALSN